LLTPHQSTEMNDAFFILRVWLRAFAPSRLVSFGCRPSAARQR
jgi:hypothetical protein